PTSPRGDAVTVGYRPESAYLKRTFTFSDCARFQAHVRIASSVRAWRKASSETKGDLPRPHAGSDAYPGFSYFFLTG
ncbi:MAG: hypothetical protein ACRD82_17485, partial [Blastocatellia bacterium]